MLDSVSFSLYEQEIMGITGIAASGKSVIAGILSGVYEEDSGEIYINENLVKIGSIEQAYEQRVYYIGLDTRINKEISIAEWFFLSRNSRKKWVSRKVMTQIVIDILKEYGLHIDVSQKGKMLSYYEQKLVEIAAAAWEKAKIIILDKILGDCTYQERHNIYKILQRLKQDGVGIIIVESNWKNLFYIADKIMVLRSRTLGGIFYRTEKGYDEEIIYKTCMQSTIEPKIRIKGADGSTQLITIEDIFVHNKKIQGSIMVRKGEIVGIIDERKRSFSFMENLLIENKDGNARVCLEGKAIYPQNRIKSQKQGIVSIPDNEGQNLVFHNMTIGENILFSSLRKCCIGGLFISGKKRRFLQNEYAKVFGIDEDIFDKMPYEVETDIIALTPLLRLIANKPKLIIIESKFNKIGGMMQEKIMEFICYAKEHGISVLYCVTTEEEAIKICDRNYYFKTDNIIEIATQHVDNTSLFHGN